MNTSSGYHKKFLHTFQVRTLRSLGYSTRVTLNNRTYIKPDWEDSSVVLMEVITIDSDGLPEVVLKKQLGTLISHCRMMIDVDRELESLGSQEDHVVVFYLVPGKFAATSDLTFQMERDRLWFYVTAQDHYVEYYIPDLVSSGVLYQCGAFNYSAFSTETNALIQAPKLYLSEDLDSYLSLVYTYFSENPIPREDAVLSFKLTHSSGKEWHWKETFSPFKPYLISLRETLIRFDSLPNPLTDTQFYCLYGYCDNASLLPLIFNHNQRTQALSVEHSLPPIYYGSSLRGDARKATLDEIQKTGFFNTQRSLLGK